MISQAILFKDGKFLMVKQHKHARIFWNFPGGHVEEGETPEEACIREVKEETGLDVEIEQILCQTEGKFTYIVQHLGGELKKEQGLLDIGWIGPQERDKWDSKTEEIKEMFIRMTLKKGEDNLSEWKELNKDSQSRWNENAEFWDDYMGEESNQFHRELIRPYTEKLLEIDEGQTVLDIACGNGNFSRRLAELGANVIAFDYSAKMIERARLRSQSFGQQIDYRVIDATNYESLMELGYHRFNSAVANMALMDIADITPLIRALYELLQTQGTFVFSITHPCFQTPGMRKVQETEEINGTVVIRNSIQTFGYLTPQPYEAIGIRGQPVSHFMFHRPLSTYLKLFFEAGFVLDGMEEPSFKKEKENNKFDWYEIAPAVILRFRKTD